ncbi:Bcr/CflA family multidrug efflux MFS transporter [Oceanisphaera arctica]|uniref:Bcr/CflA family efflux transporter n=1 Tax=Oceanisphaera arctica TaxID=641510 RepID=A0A2P5TJV8_9GAMM|nr:Bcr/CflA family multidrug efflux MFS transporter [Oceanisphaera arctica]PPL15340.1 Bcr/CflA family drug resistance efflux transporter [Oceanisphaera arctica]GHA29294.1 Bcr/CflA family drug resistance efflux transporter [Oceanisphaera arctica]
MSSSATLPLIILLGAVSALTPLAIDMYLPAMPAIAEALSSNSHRVQATLAAYTGGFALGQLLFGPLSDAHGRRPVLLGGMLIFMLAALLCALATSVESLTWLRAAQGFAGAASAVVVQALVRDLFDREDFARTMSYITLVMTLAPLIAPMLGGHLAHWFGWRSIFWVLAGFTALIALICSLRLPETLTPERRQPLHLASILRSYLRLLVTPQALGFMLCAAFSFAGMFAFLTGASFIYIELYGVSPQHVGYLFGLNVLSLMLFTTLNGKWVRRLGSRTMLRLALGLQLLAGLLMPVGPLMGWGLWSVVAPIMLYVGVISTIGSNTMASLLSSLPNLAGTASSLAGTLRFGIAAMVGAVVAALPDSSPLYMLLTMSGCALLSMLAYRLLCESD